MRGTMQPTSAATSIVNESSTGPDGNRPDASLRVRFARGVVWNLIGAVFNQGSTFAANVVLANLLSVHVFGEYAMVQSTVAVLSLLGQLATGYTATKYVAEFRSADPLRTGRVLGMLSVVSVCMGAVVSIGLAVSAPWLSSTVLEDAGLSGPMRIAALALLFSVMNGFLMGALAGLEAYATLGRACVVGGSAYLAAAILGGWLGMLEGAVLGVALGWALQCALLWRAAVSETARHAIKVRVAFSREDIDILRRFTLPAALNSFVSVPAIWFGNALLVRQEAGYQMMALFTAANSFRIIVLFLPNIVNNVNMSLLNNQLGLRNSQRYLRVFWLNFAVIIGIASAAAGTAMLFAPWLLGWFGEEFRLAHPVLVVLMLVTIPECISLALLQIVQSRARMWLTFIGVSAPGYATLALLAWLLIPAKGAVGLAWAYAGFAIVALFGNILIVRRLGIRMTDSGVPVTTNQPASAHRT